MKKKLIYILCAVMVTASLTGCSVSINTGSDKKSDKTAETSSDISYDNNKEENNSMASDSQTQDSNSDKADKQSKQTSDTVDSTTKTDTGQTSGFASTNYADLAHEQFTINGKVYTLGETTLREMIDDGVPFDADSLADADNNVSADSQERFKINLGEYWSAMVYVANYTDSNATAKDLIISEIYLPLHDDETQDIITFNFPQNMSESDLTANAGEPTNLDTYSSDGYTKNTYEYKKDSEKYYGDWGYEFEFTNGKLQYITIDYMP